MGCLGRLDGAKEEWKVKEEPKGAVEVRLSGTGCFLEWYEMLSG